MKWTIGQRCTVVPDHHLPERKCSAVVVSLRPSGQPNEVQVLDDPVWNGCLLHARGGRQPVKVEPSRE
jgi:hypothetical protein